MSTLDKMIIGFTSGLIIGILYAPAKGSKTREKLTEFGGDLKDGWDSLTDTVAAGIDSIKERTYSYTERTIEEVQNAHISDSPDMIL